MASVKAARQAKRQTGNVVPRYLLDLPGNRISRVSLRPWNVQFSCLDALRMAGLQPRFRAGSRQAKAWLSNELSVIDGVPRLSGPSHHTPAGSLACSSRLHTVQHHTGTPQLPKMSPFQGCEPARPLLHCTPYSVADGLPPPSWNLVNVSSHAQAQRGVTANHYGPRLCTTPDLLQSRTVAITKSSH